MRYYFTIYDLKLLKHMSDTMWQYNWYISYMKYWIFIKLYEHCIEYSKLSHLSYASNFLNYIGIGIGRNRGRVIISKNNHNPYIWHILYSNKRTVKNVQTKWLKSLHAKNFNRLPPMTIIPNMLNWLWEKK